MSCNTNPEGEDGTSFVYHSDSVTSVWLSGDFNEWADSPATGADVLAFDGIDEWSVTIQLDPGTYQYKFILNGDEWITDPENPDMVDDGLGGYNSVIVVPE